MKETIYKKRMDLTEKHVDTLKLIEKKNPKKDGTPYDKGVLFEMLVADLKAYDGGQVLPYAFDGMDDFDWGTFGDEYANIYAEI